MMHQAAALDGTAGGQGLLQGVQHEGGVARAADPAETD